MRLLDIIVLAAAALPLAYANAIDKRQNRGGYLAAVFTGGEEQVFFNLAPPDKPQTFRQLNGGRPKLIATTGTQGARDPSILVTEDNSKLYVLATDLKIAATNWDAAQRTGSRQIHIWESTDGVTWSGDRLTGDLMPATAGYVWAPSAMWDAGSNSYAVFWSSVEFAESDTSHTGTAAGPFIYYSHTSDFATFTSAQRWNPDTTETVIDQEIQHIEGSTYVRYLKDTVTLKRVVLERSTNGLFGNWQRIGVPVDQDFEGPASFRDIENPDRYYLWEDNYGGDGYQCFYTEDFRVPFTACPTKLQPAGMRHGGMVAIDAARYTALNQT